MLQQQQLLLQRTDVLFVCNVSEIVAGSYQCNFIGDIFRDMYIRGSDSVCGYVRIWRHKNTY